MKPALMIITGCTGSGKSDVIQQIPVDWPLTVINADSRQIYRELTIGTAIPSVAERSRFPHRLFASVSIVEKYSAGRFIKDARLEIDQSLAEKRVPVLVGGTFFYIRSLLEGIAPEVEIPAELAKQAQAMSLPALKEKLANVDPGFHQDKIQDRRRLERAYSYSVAAHSPFSKAPRTGGINKEMDVQLYEVYRERAEVYQRINDRVQQMFSAGLLAEAINVSKQFPNAPGLDTIGYREIQARLAAGLDPYAEKEEIAAEIAQNTRRFAKRQSTWFRSEKRIKRFDHDSFLHELDIQIKNIGR